MLEILACLLSKESRIFKLIRLNKNNKILDLLDILIEKMTIIVKLRIASLQVIIFRK